MFRKKTEGEILIDIGMRCCILVLSVIWAHKTKLWVGCREYNFFLTIAYPSTWK